MSYRNIRNNVLATAKDVTKHLEPQLHAKTLYAHIYHICTHTYTIICTLRPLTYLNPQIHCKCPLHPVDLLPRSHAYSPKCPTPWARDQAHLQLFTFAFTYMHTYMSDAYLPSRQCTMGIYMCIYTYNIANIYIQKCVFVRLLTPHSGRHHCTATYAH